MWNHFRAAGVLHCNLQRESAMQAPGFMQVMQARLGARSSRKACAMVSLRMPCVSPAIGPLTHWTAIRPQIAASHN